MTYPSLPPFTAASTSHLHAPPRSSSSASLTDLDPDLLTPEMPARTPVSASAQPRAQAVSISTSDDADEQDPPLECKWAGCDHVADSPDDLYDHLCNKHVGRKSTNNLCLTCSWEGCGVKCVKRDHITSHLRVHTPLKPHPCAVCAKTFKRPQDLKKHERIHTQEHHAMHKLSKAATSADPAFNSRVASNPATERPRSLSARSLSPSSSSAHSHLLPSSPYDHYQGGPVHADKSTSPTPSALAALHKKQHEQLAAYQQREMLILQQLAYNQQQTQAYAARLASEAPAIGSKRSPEGQDGFEDLLADMKKRKIEPVYDADMMHRLNSLVAPNLLPGYSSVPSLLPLNDFHNSELDTSFNGYPSLPNLAQPDLLMPQHAASAPLSIPEIRTEADLALFNEFMISLGRDATNSHSGYNNQSMSHSGSGSGPGSGSGISASLCSDSPHSDLSGGMEDLFNSDELASLGLSGMPGIPMADMATNPNHMSYLPSPMPDQSSSIAFGGLYPSLDSIHGRSRTSSAPDISSLTDQSRRPIAGLPRGSTGSVNGVLSSKPTYTNNLYTTSQPQYPELSSFVPSYSPGDYAYTNSSNSNAFAHHNFASFDSLARAKTQQMSYPVATLAPKDFYKKTYRHVAPLGTSLTGRNAVRESAERTGGMDDDDEYELNERVDEPEDMDMGQEDQDGETTPKIPIRALLSEAESDPALKLPAIQERQEHDQSTGLGRQSLPPIHQHVEFDLGHYRSGSSSSTSRSDSPASGALAGIPGRAVPIKRHTEDEIVRGVKRLELGVGEAVSTSTAPDTEEIRNANAEVRHADNESGGGSSRPSTALAGGSAQSTSMATKMKEMRRRHAQLIRAWMVAVNLEWRRKQLEGTHSAERERGGQVEGGALEVKVEEMDEKEGEHERDLSRGDLVSV